MSARSGRAGHGAGPGRPPRPGATSNPFQCRPRLEHRSLGPSAGAGCVVRGAHARSRRYSMRHRNRYPALCATLLAAVAASGVGTRTLSRAAADPAPEPGVGLSLFFQNGAMEPLTLVGDAPRYPQEIDILVTVSSPDDRGIEPLVQDSELSSLDWRGVAMVEEDWRPAGDGTFIRQRFYRGAAWMEGESAFAIVLTNDAGEAVGLPLIARAGKDDRFRPTDDGFV